MRIDGKKEETKETRSFWNSQKMDTDSRPVIYVPNQEDVPAIRKAFPDALIFVMPEVTRSDD